VPSDLKVKRPYILLAISLAAAGCMTYYHLAIFIPHALEVRDSQGLGKGYSFGADFYPLWLASREALLRHGDPYSSRMTEQIQMGLFGCQLAICAPAAAPDDRAFVHPAFANLLTWPFALFPFPAIRIVLATILPLVVAAGTLLWFYALHLHADYATTASIILLTLSSYSVLEGLFAEQLGLLVGFFLAASIAALAAQKLFLAGGLLALTLVKPQIVLFIAAYLLLWSLARWRARRGFIAGFFLVSLTLVASAQWIWPHWISEWLQAIRRYRTYSPPPLVAYVFGATLLSSVGRFLILLCWFCGAVLAWRKRVAEASSMEFALTISLLLALTTLAVIPGQAVYDHEILLPGILLIGFAWKHFKVGDAFRVILGLTVLALAWQWIGAPMVIALHAILSRPFFESHVLMLPIRTAASIPFGALALLAMMTYRESSKPKCGEALGKDGELRCQEASRVQNDFLRGGRAMPLVRGRRRLRGLREHP
jgi:Glycosyltransferase family 87